MEVYVMTKEFILDYVGKSPENTNSHILNDLLIALEESVEPQPGPSPELENVGWVEVTVNCSGDPDRTLNALNAFAGDSSDEIRNYPRVNYADLVAGKKLYYAYNTSNGNPNLWTNAFLFSIEGQGEMVPTITGGTNTEVAVFEFTDGRCVKIKPLTTTTELSINVSWE